MKSKGVSVLFLVLTGMAVLYYFLHTLGSSVSEKPKSQEVVELIPDEFVLQANIGCYSCHGRMRDIKGTHARSGCISCHGGNGKAETKEKGHEGLISVPGNFKDMNQTCGACHPESVHHILSSIMTTNSGLVNVDRYIFGEADSPDGYSDIKDIGQTAADNHLRMLCARCHLGKEKTEVGPVTELSRGGGCTACHSNYSRAALHGHEQLKKGTIDSITYHPTMDTQVGNDHCFGCHSRSGRISTNFEGWHETMFRKGDTLPENETYRLLEDQRYFVQREEDLHHALGLQCIDCHVYSGIMGDGQLYMHEEDAVKIACEDCHFSGAPKTISYRDLSERERRIYQYRNYDHKEMLRVGKDSTALLNSYLTKHGVPVLKSKFNEREYLLSSPGNQCTETKAHEEVTCSACHSSWAPQCAGCHVEYVKNKPGFDLFEGKRVMGTWEESAGGFFSDLPPLGVFRYEDAKSVSGAVPGMIMTLDQSGYHGKSKEDVDFFRLFAPSKPHTTMAVGRDCKSCHNNPNALGYGRGTLTFNPQSNPPHWEFEADYEPAEDGLPLDAWIPFLGARNDKVSTRLNFTPFSIDEQQKILTVGACLTCHKQDSEVMVRSLIMDFEQLKKQMTIDCKEPRF